MLIAVRCLVPAVLLLGASIPTSRSLAGTWESLKCGGGNTMKVYEPSTPTALPAAVVSLHS